MTKQRNKGVLLILSAAILWGTTGTAQNISAIQLSPYWVGTIRLIVASAFFLVFAAAIKGPSSLRETFRQIPLFPALVAALCMAVYNMAFFTGIKLTSVSVGTTIALGSGPVWAGILQSLITGRHPSRLWWIAVSVSIFGLCLITYGSSSTKGFSFIGLGFSLLSGVAYAVYALSTKKIVAQTLDVGLATTIVFTLAAIMATPLAFLVAGKPVLEASSIGILLWLGVVATGVAYWLYGTGLKYVSGATGVALALAEPVTAVCLAMSVLHEKPGLLLLLGIGVVVAGLALLLRSEQTSAD